MRRGGRLLRVRIDKGGLFIILRNKLWSQLLEEWGVRLSDRVRRCGVRVTVVCADVGLADTGIKGDARGGGHCGD